MNHLNQFLYVCLFNKYFHRSCSSYVASIISQFTIFVDKQGAQTIQSFTINLDKHLTFPFGRSFASRISRLWNLPHSDIFRFHQICAEFFKLFNIQNKTCIIIRWQRKCFIFIVKIYVLWDLIYLHIVINNIFYQNIFFQIDSLQVSFHLPLHRYLAVFLCQAVARQGISLSEVLPAQDYFLNLLMMHPLRVQVSNLYTYLGAGYSNTYFLDRSIFIWEYFKLSLLFTGEDSWKL